MPEFVKVAELSEVQPGNAIHVEANAIEIALINLEGTIYAINDVCTHRQCSLSEGNIIEGETITCPCHMSVFDIKTGEVLESPALTGVATYNVRLSGNDIEVEV